MISKFALTTFFITFMSWGQAPLDEVIKNTLEKEIQQTPGTSLDDIAKRTMLEQKLLELQKEKSRRFLKLAIEGTNISQMKIEAALFPHRYQKRTEEFGAALNEVMDRTIKASNPAIAGREGMNERPLVLNRDVDTGGVYLAKDHLKGEIVVYKTKDLRGRTVYKDLKGNTTDAVIQKKLFAQDEVIVMDEKGDLLKGTPRAVYSDGTIEVKDKYGLTHRRRPGSYHLTTQIDDIKGGEVKLYSGKTATVKGDLEDSSLSDKERKALKALKAAMCDM